MYLICILCDTELYESINAAGKFLDFWLIVVQSSGYNVCM